MTLHYLAQQVIYGLSVGATYMYANPLNSCATPYSHYYGPMTTCRVQATTNFNGAQLNPDDTLPGYQLNTLDEAYLTYKDKMFYVKVGNQIINQPWAPSSDSRIMPSAFQGADAIVNLNSHWLVEGTDMIRFEPRNASDFSRQTLVTDFPAYPGDNTLAPNIYNPSGTSIQTPGFVMGRVGYTGGPLTANLYDYNFVNIATAYWLDGKYAFNSVPRKPFNQIQGGDQQNAGQSVIGKIDSQVYGIQGGVNLNKNFLVTVAYNDIPIHTATVTLPAGITCGTNNVIAGTPKTQSLAYFLPAGGTGNCTKNANGTTNIYYGGWASPYSYSYATDPLFTTSLTQGMVDRASPGQAYLARVTFTSDNRKLVSYVSYASYDYNNPAYAQATRELNFDALYYRNKPAAPGALYKGFLVRWRYGGRDQTGNNAFGGAPLFKYNRFQAEYDI